MGKSITQDMAYRQSLMRYAEKYGVSRASRKYNKSRSYIYFWKARWDGSVESLACQSRRSHRHPNQHTEAEMKLIRDMRRRNPTLGMVELWHRLRKRGYTRCPESLFRVMRRQGMFPQPRAKTPYRAKPYEQMQYPGQRVQVDVKVVPLKCLANPEERLYQYTAIDEYTRLRYLGAYPEQSTYSSADFLEKMAAWFKRRGIQVECVQTDNGFEFTNRFSNSKKDLPTQFELTAARLGIRHKLIRPYTPRHNGEGGTQPPRGSEAVLQYAPLLLSCRFWCAARCTPKSLQQLAHAPSFLALSQRKTCRFPLSSHCPICLTNLHFWQARGWARLDTAAPCMVL